MADRDIIRGKKRTAETRGRKPKPKKAPDPLPANPPGLLKSERSAYKRMRALCLSSGRVTADDVEMVVQVAGLLAYLERIKKELAALPSILSLGGNGNDRVHPLAIEVRQTQSTFRQALGQLMLSPRSRSASRLTKGGLPGVDAGPMGAAVPPRNATESKLFGGGGATNGP